MYLIAIHHIKSYSEVYIAIFAFNFKIKQKHTTFFYKT
jgi:hypothetical protein